MFKNNNNNNNMFMWKQLLVSCELLLYTKQLKTTTWKQLNYSLEDSRESLERMKLQQMYTSRTLPMEITNNWKVWRGTCMHRHMQYNSTQQYNAHTYIPKDISTSEFKEMYSRAVSLPDLSSL